MIAYNHHLYAETQYSFYGTDKIYQLDAATGGLLETFDRGITVTSCGVSVIDDGKLYSGDLIHNKVHITQLARNTHPEGWDGAFNDGNYMNAGLNPIAVDILMSVIN